MNFSFSALKVEIAGWRPQSKNNLEKYDFIKRKHLYTLQSVIFIREFCFWV